MSGALLAGCDSAQKNEVTMLKDSNAQLTIERDDARNALDLIESEVGLVMARARLEAERRKAAREAEKA